jgi:hypothetical protein
MLQTGQQECTKRSKLIISMMRKIGVDSRNRSLKMMRPLSQHRTIPISAQDNICIYFIVTFVLTPREDFWMLIMILSEPLELVRLSSNSPTAPASITRLDMCGTSPSEHDD